MENYTEIKYESVISKYINEVAKVSKQIRERNRVLGHKDLLMAYRGESRDYGSTKLMPSLFRKSEYVQKEELLFELLDDYNFVNGSIDSNIDKAITAQHYIEISRTLDITFNVLPSLYFAAKSSPDKDGYIYVFGFPKYFSPHSFYLEDLYKNVLSEENIVYDKNFRVMTHSRSNERIKAQKGGFIFFPGKKHSPISSVYYEAIKIEKQDKLLIIDELKDYFDIDDSNFFPSKDKHAEKVKKIYEAKPIQEEIGTPSVIKEIDYCFERLNYELEIQMKKAHITDIDIMRIIRKEEKDLLLYLESVKHLICSECEDDKSYEELVNSVKYKFELLRGSKV